MHCECGIPVHCDATIEWERRGKLRNRGSLKALWHNRESNHMRALVVGDTSYQWRSQPKNWGGAKNFWGPQNVWFYASNTILFRKTPLKAQIDYIFQKNWGSWPLSPPVVRLCKLLLKTSVRFVIVHFLDLVYLDENLPLGIGD